jgi:hypothetical protein
MSDIIFITTQKFPVAMRILERELIGQKLASGHQTKISMIYKASD